MNKNKKRAITITIAIHLFLVIALLVYTLPVEQQEEPDIQKELPIDIYESLNNEEHQETVNKPQATEQPSAPPSFEPTSNEQFTQPDDSPIDATEEKEESEQDKISSEIAERFSRAETPQTTQTENKKQPDKINTGENINIQLIDRNVLYFSKPKTEVQESGIVAIKIWVNSSGSVVRAVADINNTSIVNHKLWEVAKKAALETKFNNSPNKHLQQGLITYRFELK